MNDGSKTVLERAFELARTGRFRTPTEIKHVVASEGYATAAFTGKLLNRQLRGLIVAANSQHVVL